MNQLDILCAGVLGLTGFFMVLQVLMLGAPKLGWISRPWYSRWAMTVVALGMWARAWTICHGRGDIPAIGLFVSLALMLWQFVDLLHVITTSYGRRSAAVLRTAMREHKAASRLMGVAIRMLHLPPYGAPPPEGAPRD